MLGHSGEDLTVAEHFEVVFAIRQISAALIGGKPKETRITTGMATAVPYPYIDSKNYQSPKLQLILEFVYHWKWMLAFSL